MFIHNERMVLILIVDSMTIACYGALVSTIVAVIQLYTFFKSRGFLSLDLDPMHGSYYINSDNCLQINYQGKYFLILSVKLSNKSSVPTTIDGIYLLNSNNKKFYSFKEIKLDLPFYHGHTVPFNDKLLTFPLRLNQYDSIKGTLVFPLDNIYQLKNVSLNQEQGITVYIESPRGIYPHEITVLPYVTYMEHHLKRNLLQQSKKLK